MLSAICPSCSAPLRFEHAASVCARCPSCGNSVVRSGDELEAIGKVSSYARDLSPLQVGATGRVGSRGFRIAGVLRKARERVRWSEWFLVFDDDSTGWLGEGNGQWQLFDGVAQPVKLSRHLLSAGTEFELSKVKWHVVESAEARVAGVEGELPFAVTDAGAIPYADLRSIDGRFTGTIDFADGDPVLWAGRIVTLPALELKGLRPITGWSDPTLTDMAGPEITLTRTLSCPNCGGNLSLRAPGQAQAIGCEYCGSELGVEERGDASEAVMLAKIEARLWKPALSLGRRATLEGTEYELIGAMQRSVSFEGIEYPWTEYLLHNPFRGFAWLVEANGHWNLVRHLADVPKGARRKETPRTLEYRGERFQHFQGGRAKVRRVIGEFTWEVHQGDQVITDDWVCPPMMLSRERVPGELTWTLGVYLEPEAVAAAFGPTPAPAGVSPNQPNPYVAPRALGQAVMSALLFCAMAIGLALLPSLLAANELVLSAEVKTDPLQAEQIFLTDAFIVPTGDRRNLRVALTTDIHRSEGEVYIALLNTDDGAAYLVPNEGGSMNKADAWLRSVNAGNYIGRLEYKKAGAMGSPVGTATISVRRDPPWPWAAVPVLLWGLGAFLALIIARSNFEARRWANSDHA